MERRGFLVGILGSIVCAPLAAAGVSAGPAPAVPGSVPPAHDQEDFVAGSTRTDWAQESVDGRLRRGARRIARRTRRADRRIARVRRRTARRALRAKLRTAFES